MNDGQTPSADAPIRVTLMCENPIVCKTLGPRLAADPTLAVAGLHDCVIDRVPDALAQNPNVVILVVSRITPFNLLICQALRQECPALHVVILPSYLDSPDVKQHALVSGADVVIEKSIDTPALLEQIHALANHAV